MAAKIDAAYTGYLQNTIRPLLACPAVEFVGEIGEAQKAEFLGNAEALLFPIAWPEPFGMVMIEAASCGTPVIAFGRGSVPGDRARRFRLYREQRGRSNRSGGQIASPVAGRRSQRF